jgi:hypothetical protein
MRLPLAAALLALSVPAFSQNRAERDSLPQAARRAGAAAPGNMQTPAGEAPGPWILGTIGIGPQPYAERKKAGAPDAPPEMPPGSQIALKGFAIKVGEHGEATVAYDLDLCRMAGAWVGKFTTPMNLMSRGEYPTALGEVAFTTGEVAGFQSEGRAPARPTSTAVGSGTRGSASLRVGSISTPKSVDCP